MSFKDANDHATVKHREQVFARLRAELLRESGNRASFERTKAHIQSDREVQRDPELRAMVQAFIAEREAAFKATHPSAIISDEAPMRLVKTPEPSPVEPEALRREAATEFAELDRQFHEHVSHFRESEARLVHGKLAALHGRHPDLAGAEAMKAYERSLMRMKERRVRFEHHVDETAQKAAAAAEQGDHETAARALKRLSSIHALHPRLLDEARFSMIREMIAEASDEEGHREAARRLIERERAVAAELKGLAARIHEIHQLSRTIPHEGAAYRKAEAAYHQAVGEVRSHDADWLGGVILELVELLSVMSDPPPEKAQEQVDHFLASVRVAIEKLRRRVSGP